MHGDDRVASGDVGDVDLCHEVLSLGKKAQIMSKSSISASSSPPSSSAMPAACCRPTNSILVGTRHGEEHVAVGPGEQEAGVGLQAAAEAVRELEDRPAAEFRQELRRAAVALHQVDAADVVREILLERGFLHQGHRR